MPQREKIYLEKYDLHSRDFWSLGQRSEGRCSRFVKGRKTVQQIINFRIIVYLHTAYIILKLTKQISEKDFP